MKERKANSEESGDLKPAQEASSDPNSGAAGGRPEAENAAEPPETIGNTYDTVRPAPGNDDPSLDPYEIEFRPEFRGGKRGPEAPFVNDYGVVIGDHDYESPNSPLQQWSRDTEPSVMAGEQWVHPYKDIGFRTHENRDLFEKGIPPASGLFMHPTLQTSRHEGSKSDPRRSGFRQGDPRPDPDESASGDGEDH